MWFYSCRKTKKTSGLQESSTGQTTLILTEIKLPCLSARTGGVWTGVMCSLFVNGFSEEAAVD